MSKHFYLRYKDEIIGTFTEHDGSVYYEPNHKVASTIPKGWGYPLGLFPVDLTKKGHFPNIRHVPTMEDIDRWLSERVFPKERSEASNLLISLGLGTYNLWEIAKQLNAVSSNDPYWMSSNPTDKMSDIHPKFKLDKRTAEIRFRRNRMGGYKNWLKRSKPLMVNPRVRIIVKVEEDDDLGDDFPGITVEFGKESKSPRMSMF